MTKGRMLHAFCLLLLLLRFAAVARAEFELSRGRWCPDASTAEVGHGARVIRLVAALGLSKA